MVGLTLPAGQSRASVLGQALLAAGFELGVVVSGYRYTLVKINIYSVRQHDSFPFFLY